MGNGIDFQLLMGMRAQSCPFAMKDGKLNHRLTLPYDPCRVQLPRFTRAEQGLTKVDWFVEPTGTVASSRSGV